MFVSRTAERVVFTFALNCSCRGALTRKWLNVPRFIYFHVLWHKHTRAHLPCIIYTYVHVTQSCKRAAVMQQDVFPVCIRGLWLVCSTQQLQCCLWISNYYSASLLRLCCGFHASHFVCLCFKVCVCKCVSAGVSEWNDDVMKFLLIILLCAKNNNNPMLFFIGRCYIKS